VDIGLSVTPEGFEYLLDNLSSEAHDRYFSSPYKSVISMMRKLIKLYDPSSTQFVRC